jgi:hypothetical protein
VVIRRTGTTRDGIVAAPDVNGRAMAGRVLSELAGQRGRLILVTGDRHEPTSHELTSLALRRALWSTTWLPFTMCPVANQEVIGAAPRSRPEEAPAGEPFR